METASIVALVLCGLLVAANRIAATGNPLRQFEQAARDLGLSQSGPRATGTLDARLTLDAEKTADPTGLLVRCRVELVPPLRMALDVQPRASVSRLFGSPSFLGTDFDDAFSVSAVDLRQAKELLAGRIARELVRCDAARIGVRVSDDWLELRQAGLGSAEPIARLARLGNDLAALLLGRRPLLVASDLSRNMERAFVELVKERGGRHDAALGAFELATPAGTASISYRHRGGDAWETRFRFDFTQSLRAGLALSDEAERSTWARITDPDVTTGDAEFDRRFVVRATTPEAARRVLGNDARCALLALRARVKELAVDDTRIEAGVPSVVRDVRRLRPILDALVGAADALAAPAPHPNAYR